MEDNSHIVKALENVSIEDFDIKSLFVTRCDNCHAEECRGMFDKCLILRILIIDLIALTFILNIWNF